VAQKVEVGFRPQGRVLHDFMASDARVQLIRGPLGSAKTATCAYKVFHYLCSQTPNAKGVRPSRWAIVRNTYPDLRSSTIKDWREMFGEDAFGSFAWTSPPEHEMAFKLGDGTRVEATIMFIALDREDDVRKIRGTNLTGIWFNEIKEIPKAIVDMADGRHGRYPTKLAGGVECDWHGIIGDYNSPDEDHWLYRLAEEDKPEGWAFFRQPGGVIWDGERWVPNADAENLGNLPEGYYARQVAGKDHDWIKVNLGNEYGYVQDGKPVYPEYSDSVHCREFEADPHLPLILGWDFGLTPSVEIAQMSPRGQLRFVDELCAEDMGVYQFARDVVKPHLARHYAGYHIGVSWADPAGTRGESDESRALDILNDVQIDADIHRVPLQMGFYTEPAAGGNAMTPRLEAVKGFLTRMIDGAPGMLVHPRCKMLRAGFNGKYCYRRLKVSGDERYRDVPDKNDWSHPHDAAQNVALAAQGGYVSHYEPEHYEPEHYDEPRRGASPTTGY